MPRERVRSVGIRSDVISKFGAEKASKRVRCGDTAEVMGTVVVGVLAGIGGSTTFVNVSVPLAPGAPAEPAAPMPPAEPLAPLAPFAAEPPGPGPGALPPVAPGLPVLPLARGPALPPLPPLPPGSQLHNFLRSFHARKPESTATTA